jgi:hypothetical protein
MEVSGQLHTPGGYTRYPWNRRLAGPKGRSELCRHEKKNGFPRLEKNPGRPSRSSSLYRLSLRISTSGTDLLTSACPTANNSIQTMRSILMKFGALYLQRAVQYLRQLNAGISPWSLRLRPGWRHVRFMVKQVHRNKSFPSCFCFPLLIIIPPLHRFHLSPLLRCTIALSRQHTIILLVLTLGASSLIRQLIGWIVTKLVIFRYISRRKIVDIF